MIDKQRIKTFVLGGAIGALVGIVLAPRSGKELRGSIADRAGEARDRSRENYFETQERLRERLAEMGDGETRRPTDPEEVPLGTSVGTSGAETPAKEPTSEPDPGAHQPHFRGLRDVSRERREEEPEAQPEDGKSVEDLAGDLANARTDDRVDDGSGDRSEELRRKVQKTRDRLRRRTEGPGDGQA